MELSLVREGNKALLLMMTVEGQVMAGILWWGASKGSCAGNGCMQWISPLHSLDSKCLPPTRRSHEKHDARHQLCTAARQL